jgi:hypothetical protein
MAVTSPVICSLSVKFLLRVAANKTSFITQYSYLVQRHDAVNSLEVKGRF